MNDNKCIIKKGYETSGGTTYICIVHNVIWVEHVFHVHPVVCPKVKKETYDEIYKGYCDGETDI
jgi:hypothetical protein